MTPYRVLFICTANSARSILSEAVLRHRGGARVAAFSAGSQPGGRVHPMALEVLRDHGIDTADLHSKSWQRYTDAGGPPLDLVVTVCDRAASEACPVLFGDFIRVHWGLPDPAAVTDPAAQRAAFEQALACIEQRTAALLKLLEMHPHPSHDALAAIGHLTPETSA
ncbi:arsenate reductase ArsC [Oleiagrimonas sp. C23AA]|uniref:arsenate reductase ArsC n=1 Tax=Oleiagrimonas sp. C23AA TaxID=2719047 RepID=UPI0014248D6F|nr:arsenate reductase ArsC [Oleiagrimonas sp. C23AA]NII11698.1 arsenate reductase ArsC [Oleiagrimonas sp. C23AA]